MRTMLGSALGLHSGGAAPPPQLRLSPLKPCPAPGTPARLPERQLPPAQRQLRLPRPSAGSGLRAAPSSPAGPNKGSPRPPPGPGPLAHHGAGHGVHQALVGGDGRHRGGSRGLLRLWLWLWVRVLLGPARQPRSPAQFGAAPRRPRGRHGSRPVTCAPRPAPPRAGPGPGEREGIWGKKIQR